MSSSNGLLVQSIASAVAEARDEIARRWLERVAERVAVEKEFVFPSENLLDEVPLLISGIARYLGDDTHELSIDLPVVLKARELGQLRHEQGFSARQILWEYEILALIILQFIDDLDDVVAGSARPPEIPRRLLRAISTVQRATVEEFVERSEEKVREREERLRSFNHALSHELRNEVGAILSAAEMLREPFVQDDELKRARFLRMVSDNAQRIDVLVANLLELARLDLDTRRNRNVLLPHAAQEVARRLRSFADSHQVRVEIAPDLPRLEVNAAAVDFCLTNLLANAIKYHDLEQGNRWVRVQASRSSRAEHDDVAVIEVLDNGRGVPEVDRPYLFERFFRSTNAAGQEGTGLGLTLVRNVIERLGGRIWAEFRGEQTTFTFTLPARRADDRVENIVLKQPAD